MINFSSVGLPSLCDVDEENLQVKIIHEDILPMYHRDNNHIMECILNLRREGLRLHGVLQNFKDFQRTCRKKIKECSRKNGKRQRDTAELYSENLHFLGVRLVEVHKSLEFVDTKVKDFEKIMSDRDNPNSGYDLDDDDMLTEVGTTPECDNEECEDCTFPPFGPFTF